MKRLLFLFCCLTACSQSPVTPLQSDATGLDWPAALQSEALATEAAPLTPLLDVGIVVFEVGEGDPDDVAQAVRKIESSLMAQRMRQVMVTSGAWGAVRILPDASPLTPLLVTGTVIHSDGSDLVVEASMTDSTGRIWLRETLHAAADGNAYPVAADTDPFDSLWHYLANQALKTWQSMSPQERQTILSVAELRYAQTLAPEVFAGFLRQSEERTLINRLPARDDPMLARVERIRDYEYLFIDAMDEQFIDLQQEVGPVYDAWREATKAQADWLARYNARAANRESDLARGSFASMHAGYSTYRAVRMQQQDLYDYARGFSNESTPTVLAYEDRVVELDGTLSNRYSQWRSVLTEIFRLEQGFVD